MNTLRNRVQLIGHLGQDPKLVTFDSGKKKMNVTMATTEFFKNAKGEKVNDTQWHKIVAWGKPAENFTKYTKKGSEVAMNGKLIHRNYEDKEGNKRYITEVVVDEFILLDKLDANTPF